MLRSRGTNSAVSTKATAQTLCQKCLKRDIYECKASTQERPYVPRPSRTQQLANPKLVPKLTSDVPNELLRKEGIADEQLAKKELERGRKRGVDELHHNGSGNRSRSVSSDSSTSVSTISTTISRSPSPARADKGHTGQSQRMAHLDVERKRRRSSSSISYSSKSSRDHLRRYSSPEREMSHRRYPQPNDRTSRRPRRSRSSSSSRTPRSARQKEHAHSLDRSKRRRRASKSPEDRGRHRESNTSWHHRYTKSPSDSRDRSEVVRNRKSMTPGLSRKPPEESERLHGRPSFDRHSSYSDDHERYGRSARTHHGDSNKNGFSRERHSPRQSMSPFSKRLALTQAMNMSR